MDSSHLPMGGHQFAASSPTTRQHQCSKRAPSRTHRQPPAQIAGTNRSSITVAQRKPDSEPAARRPIARGPIPDLHPGQARQAATQCAGRSFCTLQILSAAVSQYVCLLVPCSQCAALECASPSRWKLERRHQRFEKQMLVASFPPLAARRRRQEFAESSAVARSRSEMHSGAGGLGGMSANVVGFPLLVRPAPGKKSSTHIILDVCGGFTTHIRTHTHIPIKMFCFAPAGSTGLRLGASPRCCLAVLRFGYLDLMFSRVSLSASPLLRSCASAWLALMD